MALGLDGLRLALGRRGSGTVSAPTFSPIDLFNAGANGFWWDISDDAKIWQESTRTTLAGNGDPVGYIDDASGNGIDWQQTTGLARPTRRLVGGLWYLEFDGTDDALGIVTAQAFYANTFDCMAYDTNGDTSGILWTVPSSNPWVGVFDSGSTSTGLRGVPYAFNDLSVDGVDQSIVTRGDAYTAINGKKVLVWDFDLNSNEAHIFGAYSGGSDFNLSGHLYNRVVLDTLSAADQSSLETWLADKAGITL